MKLVDDLVIIPNSRNVQAVSLRSRSVADIKAIILTDGTKELLGDDYEVTKAKVEALT